MIALFAVVVLVVIPVSPAFAYHSEVTTTDNTITNWYSMVDLYDRNGDQATSVVTASVVPEGLKLVLTGNETCSYYVSVGLSGGDVKLASRNLSVKIGEQAVKTLPMGSGSAQNVLFDGAAYIPSTSGTVIPVTVTLPDLSGITGGGGVLDMGAVSFTMIRVSDVSSGSVVIATTNTVTVKLDIQTSGNVKDALIDSNNTETNPDTGNSSIKDESSDVYYDIIEETDGNNKVVYLSATPSNDKNITEEGGHVNLVLNIPAGVKFYIKVTLQALIDGRTNELNFTIDGLNGGASATAGGNLLSHSVYIQSSNATQESHKTTSITQRNDFRSPSIFDRSTYWIYSGEQGMTVRINGERADATLSDPNLQLRVYMENA